MNSVERKREEWKNFGKKMAIGFGMGAVVGLTMGLMTGGMMVLTQGPLPGKTFTGTVARQMLQMGGWFGLMMSVGNVIRGQEPQFNHIKNPYSFPRFPQQRLPITITINK